MDDVLSLISKLGAKESSGLEELIRLKPGTAIIDLRQLDHFDHFRLPGSCNLPFVDQNTPSPFSDPAILKSLWKRLEVAFKAPGQELQSIIHGKQVLLVCYDGDSSRVATSVLRAKGYEADSIRGGFKSLSDLACHSSETTSPGKEQESTPWLRLTHQNARVASSPSSQLVLPAQTVDLRRG